MKIVIFGATGFSGKAILKEALSQNHQVTALARNISALPDPGKNLILVEGDVLNRTAVAAVLKNSDAVIQCLGIGGKGSGKPTTFISDATRIIIEEMEKQSVKRLIVMSNAGAGNSIEFMPRFFTRFVLPRFMKWLKVIIDDKNRMEPLVMSSTLDWTIVRCPNITDKAPRGKYLATLDGKGLKMSITLGDMAKFIVQQLSDDSFSRQCPSISN